MVLLNTATKLYSGSATGLKAYVGDTQVWPAESGGWTPDSLSGLILWLDASVLPLADGAYVDTWSDLTTGKVGTNFNVAPYRPIMKTAGLNGKSVVKFSPGGGLRWFTGLTGVPGLTWTCVYVSRIWNTATAGRVASSSYPPGNHALGYHGGLEDRAYIEGFVTTGSPQTTNWHLYTAAQDGVVGLVKAWFYSNGTILADGLQVTSGWQDGFNLNGYNFTGGEETCYCEVAEVLFYNRRLPDVERQQVEDYLRTKWGLS